MYDEYNNVIVVSIIITVIIVITHYSKHYIQLLGS
jgi:hypothetical protein